MLDTLKQLEAEGIALIAAAPDIKSLEDIRVRFLGRNGEVTGVLRGLKDVPETERPALGQAANQTKTLLAEAIDRRKAELEAAGAGGDRRPVLDFSLPGRQPDAGHTHIISQLIDQLVGIFRELGFQLAEGPEVETEFYNFDALNTPKEHPARDVHDTFFVKPGVVLRTHTTPIQIRIMEQHRPPIAAVFPGRVYRVDWDASHSPMFWQLDGLLVDEGVTFADLKGTMQHFLHRLYGADAKIRFRPHFFPFTEPSAEVDVSCTVCKGAGCRACKHSGWMEVLGCGMVHPNIFKRVGYDAEKYTGYAFGLGLDRLAMLKHAVPTIQHLSDNDLRFLQQF
ncbi:MAG: phenylalanine--tRNA ligase subunit alpha [Candidatus Hydrogenedentota bacterium]